MNLPDEQSGLTSGLPAFKSGPNHQFEARIRQEKRKGGWQAIIGLALLVVGAAVSIASYESASPGSQYAVFSGLMLVGLFNMIRGAVKRFTGD